MSKWMSILLLAVLSVPPSRAQSGALDDTNPAVPTQDSQTPGDPQTDTGAPVGQSSDPSQGWGTDPLHPDAGASTGSASTTGAPRSSATSGRTLNDNGSIKPQPVREVRQVPEPPPPLTEFQRLITASLGEDLPIFGVQLFQRVPTTFAPLDQVPVSADYTIGPGDELRIHVWGQVNFNANVKVDSAGSIYLPQAGAMHVAGLPFSAVDKTLREGLARVFRNFDLSVEMGQLRSMQVFIVGQARRPGAYTVSSLTTLVDALFASGGPSEEGSMRRIQLKRGSQTVVVFDLYDLLLLGDKSRDTRLLPGDVIFIPPVGPQVAVAGSVRNPAIYELAGRELSGGELAAEPNGPPGGLSGPPVAQSGSTGGSGAASIQTVLDLAGGRSALAADSRISIERISGHHSQEAMEAGTDAAGLATPVHDGDLVRVIPLVARFEKTVTIRGNLANPGNFAWHPGMRLSDLIPDRESLITRNYWLRRHSLGLPVPEFEANRRMDASALSAQRTLGQQDAGRSTLASAESQIGTQNTTTATSKTDVTMSAPELDWSYAVIERLSPETLTTSLLPFSLGRLVQDHDASQDLALEPGDVVTIFSQSDLRVPLAQQTKFVRLEGEFVRSGIYSVMPGEKLRALVERAGGLAPDCYLYGAEFTRVSTRAVQQQRLDEYVQSLEVQIQRNQLALASTSISDQDSKTAEAASLSQQTLLTRLRLLKATGRIVLESQPASQTVDSLPDLALEDGDRFIVPPVPASINVVGAVYDQNSFVYSSTRRVGDYLRLAGGPTRDADARRAFVIRADGSVLSRNSGTHLWGDNFAAEPIYPGDTVVLPEKIYKPSMLKGFLDWSEVISQFALGAAAINVIR